MLQRLHAGDFYILCPDNDVPRWLDERRILWAAGDIVDNRPPLSRWHAGLRQGIRGLSSQNPGGHEGRILARSAPRHPGALAASVIAARHTRS